MAGTVIIALALHLAPPTQTQIVEIIESFFEKGPGIDNFTVQDRAGPLFVDLFCDMINNYIISCEYHQCLKVLV